MPASTTVSPTPPPPLDVLLRGGDKAAVFGDPPSSYVFRRLRRLLHPDAGGNALHFDALIKVWEGHANPLSGGLNFWFKAAGKSIHIPHLHALATPAGVRLVGQRSVTYVLNNALGTPFNEWKFATTAMREQCLDGPDAFLPREIVHVESADKATTFYQYKKSSAAVPLDLLLKWHGGSLDPQHVAWIISGLFNIACYLDFIKVVHLGIELSSIMVEPTTHRVSLPGGWQHVRKAGSAPPMVSASVASLLPRRFRGAKVVQNAMTHELIRAVGRQLLGDASGLKLALGKQTPLTRFLLAPSVGSTIIEQYRAWKNATKDTFGGYHFHKMDPAVVADPSIVYRST